MIIFLNGSINAGKSTIAKLLSQKLGNSALVEVDVMREMIEWMPLDQTLTLNLKNAVSVIRNFSQSGLDVVVAYPLSQDDYDYVIESLKDLNTKIQVFTLAPKLEKILLNRGKRELTDWERGRIKDHYETGLHCPNFGEIIDNSEQKPENTVEYILNKLDETKSLWPRKLS